MARPNFNEIEHPRYVEEDFAVDGEFEIIDSYIGLGSGAVFLVKDTATGKRYEVGFRWMKRFLNGVRVSGQLSNKNSGAYSFKLI